MSSYQKMSLRGTPFYCVIARVNRSCEPMAWQAVTKQSNHRGRIAVPFGCQAFILQEAGFTLIELMVAVSILAVLAGVVLLNIGTFFGEGSKTKAWGVEQHQVSSAVGLYRVDGNTITQPFTVGPDDKKGLAPYLLGKLQFYWNIAADGSVSPGTAYLFSSDLNSLAGFTTLMGAWTAGGGVLSTVKDQNRLVANGGPWEDFTFETTATLTSVPVSGSCGYGMYYRCTNDPKITGYIFQFDPGVGNMFIVRKVEAGVESVPLQKVKMPTGFPLNGEHKISVSVQGDHHIIKVDDKMVLDFHDKQFSSGTVGLRSWGNTKVNFSEFKVSQL